MPVSLTRSRTGDVAVIALGREQSIRFLCRSLTAGTVFADYPAVLIDVRHAAPLGPRTRDAVETAARHCLTRRQLLGVVEPGENVRHAVAHARQARRLLQHPTPAAITARHAMADVLAMLVRDTGALLRGSGRTRLGAPAKPGAFTSRMREPMR